METESMRRKGRQEHGRVCSEIQASIRETYNHTRTHTQTLSSRAGGETARYLAVVAVVAVVAVDCLFVDEVTTPLSTCLLYTSPSPRDRQKSRMPSSA